MRMFTNQALAVHLLNRCWFDIISSCTLCSLQTTVDYLSFITTIKSLKNCFFPYRLLKTACWPQMYSSPTHTAVSQATGRAPSPASSCKPQTDWSIPLEGDFTQSGHHRHGRWRGKILRKTGLTAHQQRTVCTTLSFCASEGWYSSS